MSNYVIRAGAGGDGGLTPIEQAAVDSIVNAPDDNILVTKGGQFVTKGLIVTDTSTTTDGRSLINGNSEYTSSADSSVIINKIDGGQRAIISEGYTAGNSATIKNRTIVGNVLALGASEQILNDPSWVVPAFSENVSIYQISFNFFAAANNLILSGTVNSEKSYLRELGSFSIGLQVVTLSPPLDLRAGEAITLNVFSGVIGETVALNCQNTTNIPFQQIEYDTWDTRPVFYNQILAEPEVADFALASTNTNPLFCVLYNDHAYTFGNSATTSVYNITDPLNLVEDGVIENPVGFAIQSFQPSDDFALTGFTRANSLGSNLVVGQEFTINSGSYAGTYNVLETDIQGDWFEFGFAYVGDTAASTFTSLWFTGGRGVAKSANLVFVTGTASQIYVFRFDGNSLWRMGGINDTGYAALRSIYIYGSYAYISTGDSGGVFIVDISNPRMPFVIGDLNLGFGGRDLQIQNNYLYISNDGVNSLLRYDLVDPSNPTLVDSLAVGTTLNTIISKGSYLFGLSIGDDSVLSINISEVDNMTLTDTVVLPAGSPIQMSILGDYVIIGYGTSLAITTYVDISNPLILKNLPYETSYGTAINLGKPVTNGEYFYLPATNDDGLYSVRLQSYKSNNASLGQLSVENLEVFGNSELEGNVGIAESLMVGGAVSIDKVSSIAGRQLWGLPNDRKMVAYLEDFPTPVGGVITLAPNVIYVLYNPRPDLGQWLIDIGTNKIQFPDNGFTSMVSSSFASVSLISFTSDAVYNTSENYTTLSNIHSVATAAPLGSLFDIKGSLVLGQEYLTNFFLFNCGFFNFTAIGNVQDINFGIIDSVFYAGSGGANGGLTINNVRGMLFRNIRISDWQDTPNTLMFRLLGDIESFQFSGNLIDGTANVTVFDISPLINENLRLNITNNVTNPEIISFDTGVQVDITQSQDAGQSFTLDSVIDNGGDAEFQFTPAGTLYQYQTVLISSTNPSYVGDYLVDQFLGTSFTVTEIDGSPVLFNGDATGTVDAPAIEIDTADTSPIVEGTPVNIYNTVDYDGGYRVFNIVANTSFNVSYLGTVTGTITEIGYYQTGSLNHKDPRVISLSNDYIDNTVQIGGWFTTATSVLKTFTSPNTYEAINISDAEYYSVNNRFTLEPVPINEGIMLYTGDKFTGEIVASISSSKTGGTQSYRFSIGVNGITPVAGSYFVTVDVKADIVIASFNFPVELENGDTVQIVVFGEGTTDSITIANVNFIIRE